jgi:FkbM family methyltransferase
MHIETLVKQAGNKPIAREELLDSLLASDNCVERFAIGKNDESLALSRAISLEGILDDFCKTDETWKGIPLFTCDSVDKDAIVVNCSTSIAPVAVAQRLQQAGLKDVVPVFQVWQRNEAIPVAQFVQRQRDEIGNNLNNWERIYHSLSDPASKQTFDDVIRYRLTGDPAFMANYSVRLEEQYWEDFMDYREEVFVDAGGFDGDSTQIFTAKYPDYQQVHFFEPSSVNMAAAKVRLQGIRDICFYGLGLSDIKGTLSFDENAGSASSVASSGLETIDVDTLDRVVGTAVTSIKMDLEGWELKALQGSKNHIMSNKPKLAIAVYHDAPDMRLIYEFVMQTNPDYRVYLRHYTQGWSETVMYFV